MSILILLAVLGLVGFIATIIELRRDGFRATATDWSRVAGRDTLDRASLDRAESSVSYR